MGAMIVKEFLELRRDRRTLAMLVLLPIMLLIVFGYAARFDVNSIPTLAAGPRATTVAATLKSPFTVKAVVPSDGPSQIKAAIRNGTYDVAVYATRAGTRFYINGADLFVAQTAAASLGRVSTPLASLKTFLGTLPPAVRPRLPAAPTVDVLYNPGLKTAVVMVPAIAGIILVFIGTLIASLGVVRERQAGTLAQLAVMPLSPWDVLVGKIAPYFLVATVDMGIVLGLGMWLFAVPMRGSWAGLIVGSLLFLFVTLSIGVLISSVSQNQGQAMQLSMMTTLPQVLLSGFIFPVASMAPGVRWISNILPLTYFAEISRGIMLQGTPVDHLLRPFLSLAGLGTITVTLAILRFHALLHPVRSRRRPARAGTS